MSPRSVLILTCLVILCIHQGQGQLELCKNFVSTLDYDTLTVGNKKMVYFAQEKTFNDAIIACETIGMRLVTIDSEEENKALFRFLNDRVWGVNGTAYDWTYWYMWSAGKKETGDGPFVWKSTGRNVTYTSWGEGEPNGGLGEACLELRYNTYDKLLWNDSYCFIKKRYICESVQKSALSYE